MASRLPTPCTIGWRRTSPSLRRSPPSIGHWPISSHRRLRHKEAARMSILVRIPTPLRSVTRGNAEVQATADTVGALVDDLERQFPGLRDRLVDEAGELRRFINVYVNEEDIRFLDGKKTGLKSGDQVSIVPAIAGGR